MKSQGQSFGEMESGRIHAKAEMHGISRGDRATPQPLLELPSRAALHVGGMSRADGSSGRGTLSKIPLPPGPSAEISKHTARGPQRWKRD